MEDCLFCRIVSGVLAADIIYSDEKVIGFLDIHPITPVHLLVIPKQHIRSVNEMGIEDIGILGHMVYTAKDLAKQYHLDQSGYRLVINTGPDAGQSVFHLHLHILGGRRMVFAFN